MRFSADQVVGAPRDVVEAAFAEPSFYEALGQMDGLAPPQVLDLRPDPHVAHVVHLDVRYSFTGPLSGPVRAVLDPAKLTWVDHGRLDRHRHVLEFRMVPEHYPDRLSCEGSYRFEPDAGDRSVTHQLMSGELRVRYPIVGGLVERAIVTGLVQHLRQAAAILEAWASARH